MSSYLVESGSMTPKQHLIERFRALCDANGGPEEIADRTGLSAESLRQIYRGTKLPSGAARGIGPRAQKRLDLVYPGWSGLSTGQRSRLDTPALLKQLGDTLAAAPVEDRPSLASLLSQWASSGGAPNYRAAIAALLAGSPALATPAPSESNAMALHEAEAKPYRTGT